MKQLSVLFVAFTLLMLLSKRANVEKHKQDMSNLNPPDPNPEKFKTPQTFIETVIPVAKEAQKRYNIPWQFIVSQLSLESGYGRSAPYFNLMGRKARKDAAGKITEPAFLSWTWEYVKDPAEGHKFPEWDASKTIKEGNRYKIRVKDYFKAYPSLFEALADYLRIFKFKRYEGAAKYADDWKRYAHAIASAGYTTTPADIYVKHLVSIFDKIHV